MKLTLVHWVFTYEDGSMKCAIVILVQRGVLVTKVLKTGGEVFY